MKLHAVALAAVVVLAAGSAQADTFSSGGSLTDSDAVFNRPLTLTLLSGVGTAVHYDTFSFSGATPGPYTFRMESIPTPGTFDTFLALYAGSFNPAAPLSNLVALNDDLAGSLTVSGFDYTLLAGTAYTVVSTAFSNTGLGDYFTTVTPVPEVQTYALMGLGLAAIGLWVRRRERQA